MKLERAYRTKLWLRTIGTLMALGLGYWNPNARAAWSSTVVYPTGSFPLDVQNVQTAVDGGGLVILKARDANGQSIAFNFGPADATGGGVNITINVRIIGERVGQHMTTINGGYIPILCPAPVRSFIGNIDFEAPLAAAILLTSSTGTEIVGNRIHGVVGIPLPVGFTDGDGIDLFGGDNGPQSTITGRAIIAGNTIEDLSAEFANGVQLDSVAANSIITGNTVRIPEPQGTVQTIGLLAFRSQSTCAIVGNNVTIGQGGPDVIPSSIFVGGTVTGRYVIKGNNIMSDNANADGIDVLGFNSSGPTHGALVAVNHIVTHAQLSTSGGIVFYGAVANSTMLANRISGTSGNAIQVLGLDDTLLADSNRVIGNDISHLTSSVADIFFGPFSTNNLFIGHCASYIDQGVNNHVSCGPMVNPDAASIRAEVILRSAEARESLLRLIRDRLTKTSI